VTCAVAKARCRRRRCTGDLESRSKRPGPRWPPAPIPATVAAGGRAGGGFADGLARGSGCRSLNVEDGRRRGEFKAAGACSLNAPNRISEKRRKMLPFLVCFDRK